MMLSYRSSQRRQGKPSLGVFPENEAIRRKPEECKMNKQELALRSCALAGGWECYFGAGVIFTARGAKTGLARPPSSLSERRENPQPARKARIERIAPWD